MRGHVDAESLALYAEGQLRRGRTARVRAHLADCPDCARTLAALTEVTTELSHVPAPAIPSAVAARLDAALSAESAHHAAAPTPTPAPPRPPRWSPRTLRILAGTAVALVVAGGVGYTLSQGSGSSSSASGSSPSARSAPAAGHRSVQGAPFMSPGAGEKPNTSPPAGPVYVRSGTDYQHGTLAKQAKGQLAEYTVSGMSGPHRLANVPAQMRACARQLKHGHPLLLVDQARYQQHPAYVIVLGAPDTVIAANYSCVPLHSVRLAAGQPAR